MTPDPRCQNFNEQLSVQNVLNYGRVVAVTKEPPFEAWRELLCLRFLLLESHLSPASLEIRVFLW